MREAREQPAMPRLGRPVIEIIRDLRAGAVTGRALDGESRRACVAYLVSEGYAVAEIAALLGVSDRTVTRDRTRVREDLAVERDPMLLPRTVGHLMAEADSASVRLRRIARDKGAPASARVEAERATWGITVDLVRMLQSLGYLPQAPRPVSARVRFGEADDADAPEVDELLEELVRIEVIASGGAAGARGERELLDGEAGGGVGGGVGGETTTELGTLRSDLGRLAVAARIAAIGRLVDDHTTRKDSSDEDDEQPEDRIEDQPEAARSRGDRGAAGAGRPDRRAQAGRGSRGARQERGSNRGSG